MRNIKYHSVTAKISVMMDYGDNWMGKSAVGRDLNNWEL